MSFFLYTMAGSVLLLAAVIGLGAEHARQTGQWAFDYASLQSLPLTPSQQLFVFVAVVLACAVKSPLFPFHAWLPLAYGEASASGDGADGGRAVEDGRLRLRAAGGAVLRRTSRRRWRRC